MLTLCCEQSGYLHCDHGGFSTVTNVVLCIVTKVAVCCLCKVSICASVTKLILRTLHCAVIINVIMRGLY